MISIGPAGFMAGPKKTDELKDFMFCRAPGLCNAQAKVGSYFCGRHQRYEKPTPMAKGKKK